LQVWNHTLSKGYFWKEYQFESGEEKDIAEEFSIDDVGSFEIELILYNGNESWEQSDASGRFYVTVEAGKPDIRIVSISCSPATIYANEETHTFVVVKNYGDAAGTKSVAVLSTSPSGETGRLSKPVELDPGEEETLDFPWTLDEVGEWRFEVVDTNLSCSVNVLPAKDDIPGWVNTIVGWVNQGKEAFLNTVRDVKDYLLPIWNNLVKPIFDYSPKVLQTIFEWFLEKGAEFADFFKPMLDFFERDWSADLSSAFSKGREAFISWLEDTYRYIDNSSWVNFARQKWEESVAAFCEAIDAIQEWDPNKAIEVGYVMLTAVAGEDLANWKAVTRRILEWMVSVARTIEDVEVQIEQMISELAEGFEQAGVLGLDYLKNKLRALSPFVAPAVLTAGITVLMFIAEVVGYKAFLLFICEEWLQASGMGVWVLISNKDWAGAAEALKDFQFKIYVYFIILFALCVVSLVAIVFAPERIAAWATKATKVAKELQLAEQVAESSARLEKARKTLEEAKALADAKRWELAAEKARLAAAEAGEIPEGLTEYYRLRVKQKSAELQAAMRRVERAIEERDAAEVSKAYKEAQIYHLVAEKLSTVTTYLAKAAGVFMDLTVGLVFYMYGTTAQRQYENYKRLIDAKIGIAYKPPKEGEKTGILEASSDPPDAKIYVWQDNEWRYTLTNTYGTVVLPIGRHKIKLELTDWRGYHWIKETEVEIKEGERTTISLSLDRADIVPVGVEEIDAYVIEAYSGDVIDVESEGRRFCVKLAGIDAPKLYRSSFYCSNCEGTRTIDWKEWLSKCRDYLNQLIQGKTVKLLVDSSNITERVLNSLTGEEEWMVLAVVMRGDDNINEAMVVSGYACCDFRQPFMIKHVDKSKLLRAGATAIRNGSGVFSEITCPKKRIKITTTPSGRVYIDGVKI